MKLMLEPITDISPRNRIHLIRELRIAFNLDLRTAKRIVDTLMGVGESRSGEPERVLFNRRVSSDIREDQVIPKLKRAGFKIHRYYLPEHLFTMD